MTTDFPQPTDEALDFSRALDKRIREEVDDAGGWVGFERYMAVSYTHLTLPTNREV